MIGTIALLSSHANGEDSVYQLAPFSVIGSVENLRSVPGSGAYIAGPEFRDAGYFSIARITARVPGVNIREEDGYGNFINLSVRGVDGTRSNKIALMEDNILAAPSPYSAPAAYYSPKLGRMAGIEILKGSSQIAYGPHTTGGVINFLSTPIPRERLFFARATFGTDQTFHNLVNLGGTTATASGGEFGYLVELQHQQTNGFRRIDGASGDSGFTLVEPMVKLSWVPAGNLAQRFELKVGQTDFDANETYSGVTVGDLRTNPDRRYAASQFDRHTAEQWRSYLKYVVQPTYALRLESTLYYNTFQRNWDKLDGLSGAGLRGNVAQALLHEPSLAVLQGLGTGSVFTRDAYRDHRSSGWQNHLSYTFATGDIAHRFHGGVRLHDDRVTGTNTTTTYLSTGNGGFGPAARSTPAGIGRQETAATAIFAEHAVTMGRLTVTPGVRYESLDWKVRSAAGALTEGDEGYHTAGLGLIMAASEATTIFGGVYRGASAPNPGGYAGGAVEEKSLALELGLRHQHEGFRGELVAFRSTFDDLIAPQVGIGAGGVAPSTNAGQAAVNGLEALAQFDLGPAQGGDLRWPLYISATWTDAHFRGLPANARLGNGAGLFAGGRNGQAIPYVPEWKLATGASLVAAAWTARVDMSYTSKSWGTGYNGDTRLNDGAATPANPTAVDGRIDSLLQVDVSAFYDLTRQVRLVGGVHNLLDHRAIVSRAPLGPRANAPRFVYAGAELRF
jgi:Fe(3+) dicitrate transport protein